MMAFSRHSIEKHRLIELVRLNPILWDSRLPHYKRSDRKKDIKWNELGRMFNVSGARVQRTFTSLREIFRREWNHEKLLGEQFKSKWEYYEQMSFLRDVIRERKAKGIIQPESSHVSRQANNQSSLEDIPYHLAEIECPLQPDVVMEDVSENGVSSRSSSPSVCIKSEPIDTFDEQDTESNVQPLSQTQMIRNPSAMPRIARSQSIAIPETMCQDKPQGVCPTTSDNNANNTQTPKKCAKIVKGVPLAATSREESDPRQILYTKFGEFLTARLNTLEETEANDMISKILLLLAQK